MTATNGFLYFFPGMTGRPDDELIAEYGLSDIFDGPSFTDGMRGPGDTVGSMCTRSALPVGFSNTYKSDEQTWNECAGGAFWLGYYTDRPPQPEDLERRNVVDGYPFEALDGNEWVIPAAILHDDRQTCLPRAIRLDKRGLRKYETLPRYELLAKYAATAMEFFKCAWFNEGESSAEWSEDWGWDVCVCALATNYYVSQWEIAALGLIGSTDARAPQRILSLLCDFPRYVKMRTAAEEAAKKNGTRSTRTISPGTPGAVGSHPGINQPTRTSSCSETSE